MRLLNFIIERESNSQQGFAYESNLYNALASINSTSGNIAGNRHDIPDITLKYGPNVSGVELKLRPTTSGSLVLHYDNTWKFDSKMQGEEKIFLRDLAIKHKVLEKLDKAWKNPCIHYNNGKKTYVAPKDKDPSGLSIKDSYYKWDIERFGGSNEIKIDIDSKEICQYYLLKGCGYFNIQTHGFYLLSSNDELSLNKEIQLQGHPKIPLLDSKAIIRCRVQWKSNNSYQYSMTLHLRAPKKSPYNIGPGTNGTINLMSFNKDKVIKILKKKNLNQIW